MFPIFLVYKQPKKKVVKWKEMTVTHVVTHQSNNAKQVIVPIILIRRLPWLEVFTINYTAPQIDGI